MTLKSLFVSLLFSAITALSVLAQSPVITSSPPTEAVIGEIYVYDVEVEDSGLFQPGFRLDVFPEGMVIDENTGLIEWEPQNEGEYEVTVVAFHLLDETSQNFTITVKSAAQIEAPQITTVPLITGQVGVPYVYDVDATGEPAPDYSFADGMSDNIPENMTIDAATGIISWEPMESGEYFVEIMASNEIGFDTQSFTITVSPPNTPPVFVSVPIVQVTAGSDYYYKVEVTGSPAPELKLLDAPDGMAFDPETGEVSWAPQTAGEYQVVINAVNDVGEAEQEFLLEVVDQHTAPAITSTAKLNATVGEQYRYIVEATGDPVPTYALNNAPEGMTIGETNGQIRWTPQATGDYDVAVAAVNVAGSDEQTYTISVAAAPAVPQITSAPVTSAVVQENYTYDVEASGNPFPTYALTAAPADMTIDPTTGVISWMPPNAGSFGIVVEVNNDIGKDEQAFTISVSEQKIAPSITSAPVGQTFVNQEYAYQVKATGNPAPTYALVDAPAQMSINETTGLINWMPAQSGTFDVAVQATNSEGSDLQEYSIAVSINEVAPTITTTPVTQALAGLTYRYDLDAVGNPEPTFVLLESPAGMTVNAQTGLIDWTPPSPGSYSVVVEARNTQGTFTQRFTIIVGLQGSVPLVEIQSIQTVSATSVMLNATVNPNGSPTTVTFEYGEGTVTASKITAIPQNIEGFSEITVLAELGGLEENKTYSYRAVAENAVGRIISPTKSFTTYQAAYQVAAQQSFSGNLASASYRLYSIPGNVDMDVAETLPGELHKDWGAFLDTGSASDYFKAYDGSDDFHFKPGRGFWILSATDWTVPEQEVSTVELDENGVFKLRLQDGWNIIASPFDVSVPWDLVKEATPSMAQSGILWAFNGSFRSAGSMEPYQAYNYFNDAGDGAVLSLPYPGLWQGASNTASARSKATSRVASKSDDEPRVKHLVFEMAGSESLQSRAELRIDAFARTEKDPLDQYAPRDDFSELSVRFVPAFEAPYGLLAVDARPSVAMGADFELAVRAPANKPQTLSVIGLEDFVDEQVVLVDLETGQFIDLHEQSTFSVSTGTGELRYQVLIGPDAYVDQMGETLAPASLLLHQNYPNPFINTTTITYSLPEAEMVTLTVYDMLGREVRTLMDASQSAGFHEVTWDGRDNAGTPLSNGVYLMRLKAGTKTTQTVSVTRVR